MKKYSVGIDYGTLSARGLLISLEDGAEIAVSEYAYPHGVMGKETFCELDNNAALQHPADYIEALSEIMKELFEKSGVSPEEICGIGFDFTSCTVLPVTEEGIPLCFLKEFENNPHSYVKLWKHHSAEKEADEITALAEKEEWLEAYGNKVSSEWLFPKLYEIFNKAPEVYEKTARFIEAADWLVWQITGEESHSSCMAGYKGLWNKKNGYPKNEFFKKLDKNFGDIIGTKVSEKILPAGTKAGEINEKGEKLTGLKKGTAVAVPIIDAHAALPAAGIASEGKLMLIIGTSACHIVMSKTDKPVKGICGSVEDGILPGYTGYEAGQACVGDGFSWFINNCVPEKYEKEAREREMNIFSLLDEKASEIKAGENKILVLDWFNGNRTPYADYDLSGMILGITLKTKPEEIYKGILEATAFGTKAIVDLYENNGIEINEVYASGGIANKNPFLMQIYSDVLGKKISVTAGTQSGAKGSGIFAAFAGGAFSSPEEAVSALSDKVGKIYYPDSENTVKYNKVYKEYVKLSEYFAKENPVMKM